MIQAHTESTRLGFADKAKAFGQLIKFRLSLLVMLSAEFGYVIATSGKVDWTLFFWVSLGGLFVTGSANALNQILERQYDGLMQRTQTRPLPQLKLSVKESLIFAVLLGIVGIGILGYFFNLPAALLGIIALLSYAFVYTPLKRHTPFSVFVGAFPGALPPLIGWVAQTGHIDNPGLILFAFQFIWQFPHYWAIAWILDEDYQRAGFFMMPSTSGKSKFSASLILTYGLALIPMAIFPFLAGMISLPWAIAIAVLGVLFAVPAYQLYSTLDPKHARKLMFASFFYLPLMQLFFLMGKI